MLENIQMPTNKATTNSALQQFDFNSQQVRVLATKTEPWAIIKNATEQTKKTSD